MKLGVNLEVKEADGKVWVGFDPSHRGGNSKSGKSVVVASSQGNVTIPTTKGNVTIGVNAYVK